MTHFNRLKYGRAAPVDIVEEAELIKAEVIRKADSLTRFQVEHKLAGLIAVLESVISGLGKLSRIKQASEFLLQKRKLESEIKRIRALVELNGKDLGNRLGYVHEGRRRFLKGGLAVGGAAVAVKVLGALSPTPVQEPETEFGRAFFRQLPKEKDINPKDLSTLVEGRDYTVERRSGSIPIVIFAPHGGLIEPGTEQLAKAVAGTMAFNSSEYRYYAFIAHTQVCDKNGKCRSLHITSTKFREPRLMFFLKNADTAVSFHSFGSRAKDERGEEEYRVIVGGLNEQLRDLVVKYLGVEHFPVEIGRGKRFSGRHPENVTNLARDKGVQIEISRAQMRTLFYVERLVGRVEQLAPQSDFFRFVGAIRRALREYLE